MSQRFLNRRQAAEYVQAIGLPCAPKTLEKLACVGGGPEMVKFGRRVFYTPDALEAWIANRLSEPRANTIGA